MMMPVSQQISDDDPRAFAWKAYKESEEFENTKKWAPVEHGTEGSLWTAFLAGWTASRSSQPDAGDVNSRLEAENAKAKKEIAAYRSLLQEHHLDSGHQRAKLLGALELLERWAKHEESLATDFTGQAILNDTRDFLNDESVHGSRTMNYSQKSEMSSECETDDISQERVAGDDLSSTKPHKTCASGSTNPNDRYCYNCRFWMPYEDEHRDGDYGGGGYCTEPCPTTWEKEDLGAFPPWAASHASCARWEAYNSPDEPSNAANPSQVVDFDDIFDERVADDDRTSADKTSGLVERVAKILAETYGQYLWEDWEIEARASIAVVADALDRHYAGDMISDPGVWLRSQLRDE